MRIRFLTLASVLIFALGSASTSTAAHEVSTCGELLEYSPPPGSDPTSGLGRIRIASANGEVTHLFHPSNAANAPSTIEPGATRIGARVCFAGTHVASASAIRSDYVSPYRLTIAPVGSLPSTSTSGGERPIGLGAVPFGALVAAIFAYALATPRQRSTAQNRH